MLGFKTGFEDGEHRDGLSGGMHLGRGRARQGDRPRLRVVGRRARRHSDADVPLPRSRGLATPDPQSREWCAPSGFRLAQFGRHPWTHQRAPESIPTPNRCRCCSGWSGHTRATCGRWGASSSSSSRARSPSTPSSSPRSRPIHTTPLPACLPSRSLAAPLPPSPLPACMAGWRLLNLPDNPPALGFRAENAPSTL